MEKLLELLDKIFLSNEAYLGKLNSEIFLNNEKFKDWMSSFLVRRVKKEYFNKQMKIEEILSESNNENMEFLENKNLIIINNGYVVFTELGLLVYFRLKEKGVNLKLVSIDQIINESLYILSEGLAHHSNNKIEKLFPQGLLVKEIVFSVFLLLNSASSVENAFRVRDSNDSNTRYHLDMNAINKSFSFIYGVLLGENPEEILMQESDFSNLIRRSTQNGNIGRVFDTLYVSKTDRKNHTRLFYFDLFKSDIKNYEDRLFEVLEKIKQFSPKFIDKEKLMINLRKLAVAYLIENKLLPHEQLIYFNNNNYRDLLYSLITVIDRFFIYKESDI